VAVSLEWSSVVILTDKGWRRSWRQQLSLEFTEKARRVPRGVTLRRFTAEMFTL